MNIGADPDALASASAGMADMVGDLRAQSRRLAGALDDFRATVGWTEFLSDVPPLDIDVGAEAGKLAALRDWVARVGRAFAELDAAGATDLRRMMGELALLGHLPPLGQPQLVFDGRRWILVGTAASDKFEVVEVDGRLVARVASWDRDAGALGPAREFPLTAAQARNLVIHAGAGNDIIAIHPDVDVEIVIWAGAGNDLVGWAGRNPSVRLSGGSGLTIFLGDGDDVAHGSAGDDTIYTGAGSNLVHGHGGDDLIVAGGGQGARNVVYGGAGDDTLIGGRGRSYLEGGAGDDVLEGITGANVLSGGRGDDRLRGGSGDDVLIGGRGADDLHVGAGRNTVYADREDAIAGGQRRVVRVEVDGEPGGFAIRTPRPDWMTEAEHAAWLERLDSDLEMIRHTPSGLVGLTAIDDASDRNQTLLRRNRHIVIVPHGDRAGPDGGFTEDDWLLDGSRWNTSYARPPAPPTRRDAEVSYASDVAHLYGGDVMPPAAVLYHELSHSFDQLFGGTERGTYTETFRAADGREIHRNDEVPRAEINAVGFDLDGDGRIDTRPSRGGEPHPSQLTENALRGELGWDLRTSYTRPPDRTHAVEIEIEDP